MDDTSRSAEQELSIPDLVARITEPAGHLDAVNRRWLRLIAEFDRRVLRTRTVTCAWGLAMPRGG